jgi:hypothetical protein
VRVVLRDSFCLCHLRVALCCEICCASGVMQVCGIKS